MKQNPSNFSKNILYKVKNKQKKLRIKLYENRTKTLILDKKGNKTEKLSR